jgi:hypothetical protein
MKNFFDQKLHFTYVIVQATGEAFSPQQKTSSTVKNEIYINFFLCLLVIFALLDLDPGTPLNPDSIRIRIRIRMRDPLHWIKI